MGKPSKRKLAARKRAECMNAKLGVGVGSRIKSELAPDSWDISGESRGSHGQTGISVKTPTRTYNSFRAAVESEGVKTSERLNESVNSSFNTSMYEPTEEELKVKMDTILPLMTWFIMITMITG